MTGSISLYWEIPRVVMILEKTSFKTDAVFLSFSAMLSSCTRVIYSLQRLNHSPKFLIITHILLSHLDFLKNFVQYSIQRYCYLGCKYFCWQSVFSSLLPFFSLLFSLVYFFLVFTDFVFSCFFLFLCFFLFFLVITQLGIFFLVMLPFWWLLPGVVCNKANRTNIKALTEFRIVLWYYVNEFLFVSNVVL